LVEDRVETILDLRSVVGGVHGREQALSERGLFAATGGAVPRGRRLERCTRAFELSERTQHAPEMHSRERRQAHVTDGLGLADREFECRGTRVVLAGLA